MTSCDGDKKLKTLNEAIASRSPESQKRIKEMADEMILETGLQMMREELKLSQKHVAEAMGGKLSLDVELPTGKRVAFHI